MCRRGRVKMGNACDSGTDNALLTVARQVWLVYRCFHGCWRRGVRAKRVRATFADGHRMLVGNIRNRIL
jgi:hypothetical protein